MRISLSKFQCDIVLTKPDLGHLSDFLIKNKGMYVSCLCISDENVFNLHGLQLQNLIKEQGLFSHFILLPLGEHIKNLDSVTHCWEEMHRQGINQKTLVIAFGGGVVTDIAGFAASCYMRGLDLVNIPTTLLGMVDSSIGGKNGINFCHMKNLIGAIHHPKLILVAPHYLTKLPDREFRSGIAEIIKAGIIWDLELFEFLERFMSEILKRDHEKLKSVIAKACKVKSEIIRIDEKEHRLRSILNYGLTIAHAIEITTQHALFNHGEALSISMSCVARIGKLLSYVDDEFVARQDKLCCAAGLPTRLPKSIEISELLELITKDKNPSGKINLILPRKVGKADIINDIDQDVIYQALTKQQG